MQLKFEKSSRATETFTLDEGSVNISFPDKLSGESLKDLKDYLDIFYRKACRLQDDPVDHMQPLGMIGKDGPS